MHTPQGTRYRLVVSDGDYYHQCMLATAQNDLIDRGLLVEYCTLRLLEFVLNEVNPGT